MKKVTIKFDIIISSEKYDKSGFKDLVDLIQSGQWDKDTLKQDKIESIVSTAMVESVKEANTIKNE